ncbi:hypothetical protein RSOLAG1IB_06596 [Rhizoctonia solani AG-1 IB]|uniref:Uncharacterized protein n=1 Tax=Thanatephorus cucumeris (strain AG1-IB / isolate 7/3/14) TaxID=1108050 RepID=A0A0B7F8D6_THACB|nr:hypothetical protein RSOLAG1IB_06596 [Rhizoctonia solani AG-1 IB]
MASSLIIPETPGSPTISWLAQLQRLYTSVENSNSMPKPLDLSSNSVTKEMRKLLWTIVGIEDRDWISQLKEVPNLLGFFISRGTTGDC